MKTNLGDTEICTVKGEVLQVDGSSRNKTEIIAG